MLNDKQKKRIELDYEDLALDGKHGHCMGIEIVLITLGETEFARYLNDQYR